MIAAISLVAVNYFMMEFLFHGLWDMCLQSIYSSDIRNQLKLQIIHEFVDFFTVLMILIIMTLSSKY